MRTSGGRSWIFAAATGIGLGACGDSASRSAPSSPTDAGASDTGVAATDAAHSRPPPPVSPCPASDGGDDVGVWTDVSPPAFHDPSNMQTWAVAVHPLDGSVFAAAGNVTNGGKPPISTGVYKSSDCGASWAKVSTGAHGSDLATGDPWALLIDPAAPDTMYVDNGYGDDSTLFQSTNGGVDWQPLNIDPCGVTKPAFAQAVSIDPTNHLHLALTFHETCNATGTTTCGVPLPTTPMCLSQSADGGKTWSYVNGPTAAQGVTGWQEAASLQALGANTYLLLTPNSGGWITRDGGQSWKQEIATFNIYGSYAGSAHIAPDGTLYVGVANVGIYFSKADASHAVGDAWTLIMGSPAGPGATVIADDGVNLFAVVANNTSGHPYYSAPLASPETWTNLPAPSDPGPANELGYDSARHMLYAASVDAGVWRLHTR
jgi:photosystem II stability/assembly factor-like uncharacterized protein